LNDIITCIHWKTDGKLPYYVSLFDDLERSKVIIAKIHNATVR